MGDLAWHHNNLVFAMGPHLFMYVTEEDSEMLLVRSRSSWDYIASYIGSCYSLEFFFFAGFNLLRRCQRSHSRYKLDSCHTLITQVFYTLFHGSIQ